MENNKPDNKINTRIINIGQGKDNMRKIFLHFLKKYNKLEKRKR